MKKVKNVIIVLIILVLMFFIVWTFLRQPNLMPVKGQLESLDLNNVNKLMIVSHPGDESVWGGAHLISDNYLVVCISCGYNKNKTNDFLKVTEYSKDPIIMMGYSDKLYLKRDYKSIKKKLNYQHKQINQILNELNVNNLYYFGEYYSEKELDKLDKETTLDGDLIQNKINNMVKKYDGIYDDYKHMLPFEDWIGASKWKN